ncbi:MAG: hypothetical protein ABI434_22365 [Burkholderiaceae bacterium]
MSDSPTQSFTATLALFRDITLLRRGPEALPVSWTWLVATVVALPVVGLLIGSILPDVPPIPGVDDHDVGLTAIELVVPLLWGWGVLQIVGRSERFLQMMTAIFGCQLVLQPVIMPAYWAMRYFPKESNWLFLGEAAYVGLSVWSTVVVARILRSATDWPMFFCVVLVIAQGLATYLMQFAIFPDMAEALKQAS